MEDLPTGQDPENKMMPVRITAEHRRKLEILLFVGGFGTNVAEVARTVLDLWFEAHEDVVDSALAQIIARKKVLNLRGLPSTEIDQILKRKKGRVK